MSEPLSPPVVKGSGGKSLPAYLSNGVVGLRVRDNPLAAGMAMVCGFSGLHPEKKIEAAAMAPYPLAADLALNGIWLSDVPHQLSAIDQAYDFATGELTSRVRYQTNEAVADITVVTFCCRHQPTLVVQEVAVIVSTGCELSIRALLETRGIHGLLRARTRKTPGGGSDFDGSLLWASEGAFSQCGIALVTEFIGDGDPDRKLPDGGDCSPLVTEYTIRARAGRTYRLHQIVSLVPSVMHSQPDRHAERLVTLGAHYGFKTLRKANRAEWRELWKGRVLLHGASRDWQLLADAAFFYLNSSVHTSSPSSTSMFGLATWHDYHYYFGHVMWDIETFAVPPLAFSQPEAVEALLGYRTRCLAGARSNAQSFGRRGFQFPWESAPTTGHEASPSPGTAAWHEDHVSLDVALAFARFANVTGDLNFLRESAWPVLSGVANWLVSRTHKSSRGYEIRRSMGIAERKLECDNEAFTMLSARAVLFATIEAGRRLGFAIDPDWAKIGTNLALPVRNGVLVSHDGFRVNEEKAATPSPLMAVFPLASDIDEKVIENTLRYYLPLAKDYIGSPMLSSLYGVWAARVGNRKQALKLLEDGYGSFITGRFLQTLEYRQDKFPEKPTAGPFFANMGGFLMSLLTGFPNLRIGAGEPKTWTQRPAVLPYGWREIEVERLWIRGRPTSMRACQGQNTLLKHWGSQ